MAQFGEFRELVQPTVTITVGKTDEPDRLHVVIGHIARHHVGHGGVGLGHLEGPDACALLGFDDRSRAHQGDHRGLVLGHGVQCGDRRGRDIRAHHDVDFVFRQEFADVAYSRARVGSIIEQNVFVPAVRPGFWATSEWRSCW